MAPSWHPIPQNMDIGQSMMQPAQYKTKYLVFLNIETRFDLLPNQRRYSKQVKFDRNNAGDKPI